jgi:hypothetical protein
MGKVRTEITLVNIGDAVNARDGIIPKSEVRQLTVNAVVDTGAWTGTKGPLVLLGGAVLYFLLPYSIFIHSV